MYVKLIEKTKLMQNFQTQLTKINKINEKLLIIFINYNKKLKF